MKPLNSYIPFLSDGETALAELERRYGEGLKLMPIGDKLFLIVSMSSLLAGKIGVEGDINRALMYSELDCLNKELDIEQSLSFLKALIEQLQEQVKNG